MTGPVERFRELLRIPTISYTDPSETEWSVFDAFASAVESLYPLIHERLEREVVADHSLLYRWAGADATDPTVLMAHYDVVAVVEEEWTHPPFAATLVGEGAEAEIHSRGTIDDKGSAVAILEAVEQSLADGFVPAHDIYLCFGHDEETHGTGSHAVAETLRERGIRPALVLDEGGAVVETVLPGLKARTAMVGVAERGTMNLVLTAHEAGGHASTPPAFPATARLARAIHRVHSNPFPLRIASPVRAMLATLAEHVKQPLRGLMRRSDVTGPLLARVFASQGAEMNAIVRTTAVATRLSGSSGDNVLATTARATLNIRLLTGDTVEGVVARIRRVIDDDQVELTVQSASEPSPVSPWRGEAWRRLSGAVTDVLGEEVIVTPYIQLGASDSRWFTVISEHVYRFTPFHLTPGEREALHAHNERIHVDAWLRGIDVYRALIAAS